MIRNYEELKKLLYSTSVFAIEEVPVAAPGADDIAFFNPCMGGMGILYTAIVPNLELGCRYLDLRCQLKGPLHLCHALAETFEAVPDAGLLAFLDQRSSPA